MKKIILVSTGGTISMMKKGERGIVPTIRGEELLEMIPFESQSVEFEVFEFSNIPSPWMTPRKMLELANNIKNLSSNCDGLVITHGTDTLEETAYFLSLVLKPKCPVVMTAAMRAPPDLGLDGPRNLYDSIQVVLSEQAVGRGVMVVMNNEIFSPRDVMKISTTSVTGFTAPNYGCWGTVDLKVVFYHQPSPQSPLEIEDVNAEVELVKAAAGSDSRIILGLLDQGVDGLVIEALGRGNVPPEMLEGIEQAVLKIPVVITSRVLQGRVAPVYGYSGGGKTLAEMGCYFAEDLSGHKARIKLIILLSAGKLHELGRYFTRL